MIDDRWHKEGVDGNDSNVEGEDDDDSCGGGGDGDGGGGGGGDAVDSAWPQMSCGHLLNLGCRLNPAVLGADHPQAVLNSYEAHSQPLVFTSFSIWGLEMEL